MKHVKRNKIIKIAFLVLVILVGLIIALSLWLYIGPLTPAKLKFFEKVSFPFALVGGQPISTKEFIDRYQLAQKIYSQASPNASQQTKMQTVSNQLISNAKISQVAARYGVKVNNKQLDDAYAQQAAQTDGQGSKSFVAFLAGYGLKANDFKEQILQPEVLLVDLQIWFNSQASLNLNPYQQAQDILKKIQAGQDMASLAKQYSQDQTTKATGGDLGFMQLTDMAPELRESVAGMKPNDVKIISSRFGIHIIRLEQIIGNLEHFRQIFLNTADFNAWLSQQTQNIKVTQLVKI